MFLVGVVFLVVVGGREDGFVYCKLNLELLDVFRGGVVGEFVRARFGVRFGKIVMILIGFY